MPVVAAVFGRHLNGKPELALFQRKKDDVGGGLWEFPGGKVEVGESHPEALVREVEEELGLTVLVGEFLGESSHEFSDRAIDLKVYWVKTPHHSWVLNDHDDVIWVDSKSWQQLPVAPIDISLIELAFASDFSMKI